jgi:acetyl esterase/lipase
MKLKISLLLPLAALFLTGCSKFTLLDATIPRGNYLRSDNLAYGSLPRQKLDVYTPKNQRGPADVVIFFYGGDWQAGERGDYRFVGEALTSKGFVAVLPDYRLYPPATFPSFVNDGAMAVRWVHDNISHYGGDASHIYLMGHSAGAYIAVMLTLDGK